MMPHTCRFNNPKNEFQRKNNALTGESSDDDRESRPGRSISFSGGAAQNKLPDQNDIAQILSVFVGV